MVVRHQKERYMSIFGALFSKSIHLDISENIEYWGIARGQTLPSGASLKTITIKVYKSSKESLNGVVVYCVWGKADTIACGEHWPYKVIDDKPLSAGQTRTYDIRIHCDIRLGSYYKCVAYVFPYTSDWEKRHLHFRSPKYVGNTWFLKRKMVLIPTDHFEHSEDTIPTEPIAVYAKMFHTRE